MALKDYSFKVWKTSDAGAGLAVASQLGKVRHLDPMAIANIKWSQAMGILLTEPTLDPSILLSKYKEKSAFLNSNAMTKFKAAFWPTVRQSIVAGNEPEDR
jgi:hypothetical protein